jgi:hypothetical protein
LLSATGHLLGATGYSLPATGHLLGATAYLFPATGHLLRATAYLFPVTDHLLGATAYLFAATDYLLPVSGYLFHATGIPGCGDEKLLPASVGLLQGEGWGYMSFPLLKAKRLICLYCWLDAPKTDFT